MDTETTQEKLGRAADGTILDPINDFDERTFPSEQMDADFPPSYFAHRVVGVGDLYESGYDVEEVTYLTIGGGVGSFIFVDNLMIRGVSPSEIASVGMEASPYGRYKRLCEQSQIPPDERLRSDSGSTPDNIWGWPGYAVREIVTDIGQRQVGKAAKVMWKIFSEPILTDSYTPISGRVYASMDREAARIGWEAVSRLGRVLAIRMTDDGRYVAAYAARTANDHDPYVYKFIVGRYLHLAVGYPAVRMLPNLQHYRDVDHEVERAVNSYEKHDHVYEYLREHGGSVAIRGRGIVSSRVIQRISELRQHNPNIDIIHLMRRPVLEPSQFGGNSRILEHNWEIQPYNFPKASWGGYVRHVVETSSPEQRRQLIAQLGGTTTSDRRDWRGIIETGFNEGWYQIIYGSVSDIVEEDNGQISLLVRRKGHKLQSSFTVDFMIDATGLDAAISRHGLLSDLIGAYELPLNTMHRLDVSPAFELRAMRHGDGRAYASGAATLGAHFAPVDSFLGLQYAAQVAIEDMRRAGAPNIEPMDFFHSTQQWVRWALNLKPYRQTETVEVTS